MLPASVSDPIVQGVSQHASHPPTAASAILACDATAVVEEEIGLLKEKEAGVRGVLRPVGKLCGLLLLVAVIASCVIARPELHAKLQPKAIITRDSTHSCKALIIVVRRYDDEQYDRGKATEREVSYGTGIAEQFSCEYRIKTNAFHAEDMSAWAIRNWVSSQVSWLRGGRFGVFVATGHGGHGTLLASDGQTVMESDFENDYAEAFGANPKLFFYQHCAGGQQQAQTDAVFTASRMGQQNMIRFYPSSQGFVSYRIGDDSPFLRACVEIAKQCTAEGGDLETVFDHHIQTKWTLNEQPTVYKSAGMHFDCTQVHYIRVPGKFPHHSGASGGSVVLKHHPARNSDTYDQLVSEGRQACDSHPRCTRFFVGAHTVGMSAYFGKHNADIWLYENEDYVDQNENWDMFISTRKMSHMTYEKVPHKYPLHAGEGGYILLRHVPARTSDTYDQLVTAGRHDCDNNPRCTRFFVGTHTVGMPLWKGGHEAAVYTYENDDGLDDNPNWDMFVPIRR